MNEFLSEQFLTFFNVLEKYTIELKKNKKHRISSIELNLKRSMQFDLITLIQIMLSIWIQYETFAY